MARKRKNDIPQIESKVFNPHDYQRVAIDMVKNNKDAALLLDCGLGKTAIVLMAIKELGLKKVLVVAPPTVAKTVWSREAKKWEQTKDLKFVDLTGPTKQRLKRLEEDGDVYLVTNSGTGGIVWLSNLKYPGKSLEDFDMIVLDESTAFKKPSAKRTQALYDIIKPRKVILTATPMPRSAIDLYAQYRILDNGKCLGRNFTKFKQDHFYDASFSDKYEDWQPRKGELDRIFDRIAPITLSMRKEDHLKLPEVFNVPHIVEMDEHEKALYKSMEDELVLQYVDEQLSKAELDYDEENPNYESLEDYQSYIIAKNSGVLTGKLRQFANGFLYREEADGTRQTIKIHGKKIEELRNIFESTEGENVLVAYYFDQDYKDIVALCEEMGKTYADLKNKNDIERFTEGRAQVGLMHPQSSGMGLNLQEHCRRIIWYALPWTFDLYEQANSRVYRQGQSKTTFIHTIKCQGTKDEDVMQAIENRSNLDAHLKSRTLYKIVESGAVDSEAVTKGITKYAKEAEAEWMANKPEVKVEPKGNPTQVRITQLPQNSISSKEKLSQLWQAFKDIAQMQQSKRKENPSCRVQI